MAHRLAGIFAHPDDDTYGLAGTLALERANLDYTLIVATSGEAGSIADPSLSSREDLARVREEEQRAALAVTGTKGARVHFLRYPDGGLAGVPRAELVGRMVEVLTEARPQVVVTFGPEGITRHEDHVVVGQAATEAFHRARSLVGEDLARLYYVALPRSRLEAYYEQLRARGAPVPDPEAPFVPRGVPDHTIAVEVDCSGVVEVKLRAIRAHRTQQVELEATPEDLWAELFRREWFVQAWPPVTEPEGPVAGSLFEGLSD